MNFSVFFFQMFPYFGALDNLIDIKEEIKNAQFIITFDWNSKLKLCIKTLKNRANVC